jgi:hypothetical protein
MVQLFWYALQFMIWFSAIVWFVVNFHHDWRFTGQGISAKVEGIYVMVLAAIVIVFWTLRGLLWLRRHIVRWRHAASPRIESGAQVGQLPPSGSVGRATLALGPRWLRPHERPPLHNFRTEGPRSPASRGGTDIYAPKARLD